MLSGKAALAEGDGGSTEQIIDLIVSYIKSGEYSIAKDTYINLIDELDKVNFNPTGVEFVGRFKTSEQFLFEKERLLKNASDNFSIYNVILGDKMDLSVKYSKAGEIIEVVTLDSETNINNNY